MALDHYSPCPCGNGKKLKFCKCVDQPQEYEKIVKLIEGGQGLAAVDRINQLLSKTPNAAWLLALKGELTLSMQEIDSFKETAERFLQLKPDNPLALVMRSIVASFDDEPVENAARYLLEGMSESREAMPGLTVMAIRVLIRSLEASGKLSMVGYWSDILSALTGDEGPEDDSAHVDPSINLIAKAPARLIEDPSGAEWQERLAEVLSLSRTFRYAQAETKLRSILRDFPDQPGPLTHLLRAQCAQLDQNGALATAKKLSEHLELSADERAYFGAVALELEPERNSLRSNVLLKYWQVDTEDDIEQALQGVDCVVAPDPQGVEQVRQYYATIVNDEVPAKRIFSIFNKSVKREEEESGERVIASSVGTLILFGKQTDKPARLLLIANLIDDYQSIVDSVLEPLSLGEELSTDEIPTRSHYTDFLRRPKTIAGQPGEPLTIEEQGQELLHDFLNLSINLFDGQSPLEAAQDEKKRAALTSLLYHLEGEQSLVVEADILPQIYQRLELQRPLFEVDPAADSLRLITVLDMERVDVQPLNDQQLKGLTIRAMGMGATRVFYRCAGAVRQRPGLTEDLQLQVAALSGLLSVVPSINQRIDLCQELEDLLVKANAPVGRVVLQRMSLLHASGRPDEAQQTLMQAAQKYPNDPYLMSFIQYAMQAQGGAMPGAGGAAVGDDLAMKMMQNAARPAAQEQAGGSGLVLPGQESDSSGGESKLWLPGS